jgi:hypothetical protein
VMFYSVCPVTGLRGLLPSVRDKELSLVLILLRSFSLAMHSIGQSLRT